MKKILIYTLEVDPNLIAQQLGKQYDSVVCLELEDAMESIRSAVPHLIVSDYKALRKANNAFHNALNNDFILIDVPVIAIGGSSEDEESLSTKQKLYTFNIKRCIHANFDNAALIRTVEAELNKWNPNLGSYTHRFVKSLLLFADSKKFEQRMRIYLTYVLAHYPGLSNETVSDIKFASAILSTTFTTQDYAKLVEFYTNMRFAKPILRLLKNVYSPETLEEEIVSSVFRLEYHLNTPNVISGSMPPMEGIRPEIVGYLRETYDENRRFLQSYKDIIPFWEDVSGMLLKNPHFGDETISIYLDVVQECLLLCVIESHNAYLRFEEGTETFFVSITPQAMNKSEALRLFTEREWHKYSDISVKRDAEMISIILGKEEVVQEYTSPSLPDGLQVEKLLHNEYGTAHYTALEYIQDMGGLENIEEELHLMDDAIAEIVGLLADKENLAQESTRKIMIGFIREYREILQNSFYEFQAIALTLFKIENLLEGLQNHEGIDLSKLRILLVSIFDDLTVWKTTVFEQQAAPDINYLDSSILSSSYQVEALFFPPEPTAVANDDDDFELF